MLPYTTYHIPEKEIDKTENSGQWLWMVISDPLSETGTELLHKIASALKADFNHDVFCLLQPPDEPGLIASIPGAEPKLIISFGVAPTNLGIWIDLPKPGMCIMESYTFILSLPVDALANHAGAKKELWRSMQLYLEQ